MDVMVATATGIRLSAAAAARSATHQPLLEMDADGLAELPADAATIAVVAAWMERLVTDDATDAELVAQLAAHPARFAAALELANYLQLEPLVATLLGSIGADGGTGLLRACMASVRDLPSMLAAKLGVDGEKVVALLDAVLACDAAATVKQ